MILWYEKMQKKLKYFLSPKDRQSNGYSQFLVAKFTDGTADCNSCKKKHHKHLNLRTELPDSSILFLKQLWLFTTIFWLLYVNLICSTEFTCFRIEGANENVVKNQSKSEN